MRRGQRRGISLLEVVVAIAILAVMSAMAAQSIFNAIELKDILAERDATTRSARVAMGKIRRDLELAFLTKNAQAVNTYQTVFVGLDENPDRIYLASFAHQRLYRDSRECDQTEITAWAEPGKGERKGFTLFHREAPRIDHEPDEQGVIYPLAYDVRSFDLRYLDPRTNEWVDEWDSRSGETAGRLPRAVQIGLVLIGADPDDKRRTIDLPFLSTVLLEYADRVQRQEGK